MPLAAIDWTSVIVSALGAAASIGAAGFAFRVHISLRMPSGGKAGDVIEQTRDLSAVSVSHTSELINHTDAQRQQVRDDASEDK